MSTIDVLISQISFPDNSAPDNWWGVRNDSGLRQLAALALGPENSPDDLLRRVFQALSRAELLRPGLTVLGDGGRAEIKISSVRTFGGEFCTAYEFDLWQELSLHGRFSFLAENWGQAALTTARLAVLHNLVDAYYHLAYLNDTAEALKLSLRLHENVALRLRSSAEADENEVDDFERIIKIIKTRLARAREQCREQRTCLCLLAGLPDDSRLPVPVSLYQVNPLSVNSGWPLSVLTSRPDLKEALSGGQRIYETGYLFGLSLDSVLNLTAESLKAVSDRATGPAVDLAEISSFPPGSDKAAIPAVLTSALDEFDLYYRAYLKIKESLALSEREYSKHWCECRFSEIELWEEPTRAEAWAARLHKTDTARLTMLKRRYQMIQYENMLYKIIGRLDDGRLTASGGRAVRRPESTGHSEIAMR